MNALNISGLSLDCVKCTEKAQSAINQTQSHELKGRERQFLLLLMRADRLSAQACEQMLDKVDLLSLIERGYLYSEQLNSESLFHGGQISKDFQSLPFDEAEGVEGLQTDVTATFGTTDTTTLDASITTLTNTDNVQSVNDNKSNLKPKISHDLKAANIRHINHSGKIDDTTKEILQAVSQKPIATDGNAEQATQAKTKTTQTATNKRRQADKTTVSQEAEFDAVELKNIGDIEHESAELDPILQLAAGNVLSEPDE